MKSDYTTQKSVTTRMFSLKKKKQEKKQDQGSGVRSGLGSGKR